MAHFVVAKEVQQLSESVVVAVDLEDLEVQPVASCERPGGRSSEDCSHRDKTILLFL